MHTEFQEQHEQWQALYHQWSSAPPKPAEGINLGEGALPKLASKIATAYTAGATAGMTKTRFTLPRVDGDDGTAEFVLKIAATCGMLYVAQTVASTTKEDKAPRVLEPEYYKGTLSEFPIFQVQLQIVFQSDPTRFSTHKAMILYAASFLRGPARDWWTPHMDTKSGAVRFETYEEFMDALSKAFDDPDATATAAREIRRLRQKDGTCADYYAKFVTLAARLGWNTEAQIEQFKYGLNEELRRALTYRDDPTGNTLEDHARVCIMIDNKQRAFEASRRNNRRKDKSKKDKTQKDDSFRPFRPSAPAPTNPSVVGEPMDLSTARFKLTPQERERRRANNLCLQCGGQGPRRRQLQVRSSQEQSRPPTSFTTASQKGTHHRCCRACPRSIIANHSRLFQSADVCNSNPAPTCDRSRSHVHHHLCS